MELTYQFATMDAAQSDLLGASGKLEGINQQVRGHMNQLMGSWTEGQAAATYQSYQNKWNSIMGDVHACLNSLGQAVGGSSDNGKSAERANTQMFNV